MKAISLWQPWATAMALGLKRVETRHWWTSYRGLIAIHAAKRWTREEREIAEEMGEFYDRPELASPPLGAIVATGFLREVRRTEELRPGLTPMEEDWGNYGPGRFGWLFEDVVALSAPIPCKGAQGFFEVPIDMSELVSVRTANVKRQTCQGDLFGSSTQNSLPAA